MPVGFLNFHFTLHLNIRTLLNFIYEVVRQQIVYFENPIQEMHDGQKHITLPKFDYFWRHISLSYFFCKQIDASTFSCDVPNTSCHVFIHIIFKTIKSNLDLFLLCRFQNNYKKGVKVEFHLDFHTFPSLLDMRMMQLWMHPAGALLISCNRDEFYGFCTCRSCVAILKLSAENSGLHNIYVDLGMLKMFVYKILFCRYAVHRKKMIWRLMVCEFHIIT